MRAAAALLALIIAVGLAGYVFARGIHIRGLETAPITQQLKKGLDITSGVRLVLQGVESPEAPVVTADAVRQAMKVIDYRVNALGVSEPLVQMQGDNRIVVELAGVTDIDQAKRVIGTTAVLTFLDPEGNVVVTGKDLEESSVVSYTPGDFQVGLTFKEEGRKAFAEATRKWKGQQIAIILDEAIISAPMVRDEITQGNAVITGNFTREEAQELSDLLNGGALPVKLKIIEDRSVSATLGSDSLNKSLLAGKIGLALVALFMLVYYRLPGLLANVALSLYLMLTVGALVLMGAVLTLPGIAGLILSLGMAVDANVIIFERIREELRTGKGLRGAIDVGFSRALTAVLDSNVTTVIAALVLYLVGSGPIRGFGLTLGLGVILSMFTAVTFSRSLVRLLAATRWFSRSLFGVREEVQA